MQPEYVPGGNVHGIQSALARPDARVADLAGGGGDNDMRRSYMAPGMAIYGRLEDITLGTGACFSDIGGFNPGIGIGTVTSGSLTFTVPNGSGGTTAFGGTITCATSNG
ncbi:MAG: hypothetical protein QOF51_812, partial [Chloroflexota bacterium]|nr:hypothetical protein [Chloroflexota bacterium]